MRSAVRSRPAARWSPRSSAVGGGNVARLDLLERREDAGDVVVAPPSGRSDEQVGCRCSGSTTHSRPRAATRVPGRSRECSSVRRQSSRRAEQSGAVADAEVARLGAMASQSSSCGNADDVPAERRCSRSSASRVALRLASRRRGRAVDEDGDVAPGQPVDEVGPGARLGDERLGLVGQPVGRAREPGRRTRRLQPRCRATAREPRRRCSRRG